MSDERDELIREIRRVVESHASDLREAIIKYGLPPECEPRMPAAIEAFILVLLDEPLPSRGEP